jgi:hypothetical protein
MKPNAAMTTTAPPRQHYQGTTPAGGNIFVEQLGYTRFVVSALREAQKPDQPRAAMVDPGVAAGVNPRFFDGTS